MTVSLAASNPPPVSGLNVAPGSSARQPLMSNLVLKLVSRFRPGKSPGLQAGEKRPELNRALAPVFARRGKREKSPQAKPLFFSPDTGNLETMKAGPKFNDSLSGTDNLVTIRTRIVTLRSRHWRLRSACAPASTASPNAIARSLHVSMGSATTQFYSTMTPSRNRSISLKTKAGCHFYSTMKPGGNPASL
jgi:hypothetical protein